MAEITTQSDESTTFTVFPKLPAELRIKIYEIAAKQETQEIRKAGFLRPISENPSISPPIHTNTPPSDLVIWPRLRLLEVSHESRDEIKKKYHQEFGQMIDLSANEQNPHPAGLLINPDIDVLMLDFSAVRCLAKFGGAGLLHVKYIAIYDQSLQIRAGPEHNDDDNENVAAACALFQQLVTTQKTPKLKWMDLILDDQGPDRVVRFDFKAVLSDYWDTYFLNSIGSWWLDKTSDEPVRDLHPDRDQDGDEQKVWQAGKDKIAYPKAKFMSELRSELILL